MKVNNELQIFLFMIDPQQKIEINFFVGDQLLNSNQKEQQMASDKRYSCTIELDICSPAKRRTPECYTDDDYSDSDSDTDPEPEQFEYSVPTSFHSPDHFKQLKQKLKKIYGRRLISVEFEIISDEKLQTLQSIESVLTPFGDRDKYKAIGLTCKDADGKSNTFVHPFPKDKDVNKPDPELVQRYKDMYPGTIEKVGFCELNEILDNPKYPNRQKLFHYSTPDHPEIKPLSTKHDIKIAKLEEEIASLNTEVISLKTMFLEMQKMISGLEHNI